MARKPQNFPAIEYFGSSLTPGTQERYTREQDNPLSEAFVPLEERGALEQARFWAQLAKRKARSPMSELDPPEREM